MKGGEGGGRGRQGREKVCCVPVRMIHYITAVTQYGYELVLGTRWFGYELVIGTS